jgi:hypothetical protein
LCVNNEPRIFNQDCVGPAYSVTPVVGDGRWIWNKPPKDQTGYLEPRPYELEIGIELEGVGSNTPFMTTTPVPVEHPEQKIEEETVEMSGCQAQVRKLTDGAAQLFAKGRLAKGQRARATARYKLTLFKQHHNFQRDQFPVKQEVPKNIRGLALQDSPGIQTRAAPVRELAKQLSEGKYHPWDKVTAFAKWVPRNIRPQLGSYTSVLAALKNKLGDCEEMSAVFVALCRAIDIPARLVWIPNHNWAEFYLVDKTGKGHWIPAHTACYFWFGWTGAHELVLQKGDRIDVPETRGKERLLGDWIRYMGRKPKVRYIGNLKPLPPSEDQDAGPGARSKNEVGDWQIVGKHKLDRYMRR